MNRLADFQFDRADAAFPFSTRLARENGWSQDDALSVIEEYRRFLHLCCEAGHPVTPSDAVDQAWHLHLCYTRSYWEDLCRDTLGRPVHHGPTRGGSDEDDKFTDWYQRTLESYQAHFGGTAPPDIWPPAAQRFAPRDFRRIDVSRHLVVSKRSLRIGAVAGAACLALVSCTSSFAHADFGVVIILFVIFTVIVSVLKMIGGGGRKRRRGRGGKRGGSGGGSWWVGSSGNDHDSSGCSSSGCSSSGGGGGCGGCGGGGD